MPEEQQEIKVEEDTGQINALSLSDEDIMNMTEPPGSEVAEGGDESNNEGEADELVRDDDGSKQQPEAKGGGEETGDGDPSGDPEGTDSGSNPTGDDPLTGADDGLQKEGQETAPEKEVKKESKEDGKPAEIDYKAELAKLFTPFKANGRQMQIHNIDDAIALMQMGANYNKKMAGLKPNLKLMKMLEKNELLDESKLSFLIDLQRKDPAAIAKFMQEGEIDPIDIDVDEGDEYEPNAYTVDDKEVELDGVLEDIQDTSTFQETIDIISNKWDGASKQVLLDNPKLIAVINEHVSSGIYGQIHEIIENERAVGRLPGMNDIEAYKHVGDVIQANGGFAPQQIPPKANEQQQPAPAKKAAADPKLKSRKRAAAATTGSPGQAPADYNPLAMSDEEFEKVAAQYM